MHTKSHMQRVSRREREGQRVFALIGLWVITASTIGALAIEPSAQAAVFNVPSGDVAALINAINTANGNGEDDTINLAAGTYILTAVDNETDFGSNGLPSITKSDHRTLVHSSSKL